MAATVCSVSKNKNLCLRSRPAAALLPQTMPLCTTLRNRQASRQSVAHGPHEDMKKNDSINGGTLAMALKLREIPVIGIVGRIVMHCLSVTIPKDVKIGKGVILNHNCYGTVMHPLTTIGDYASIYQNVTLGRKYPFGHYGGIVIGEHATVCAGAKVLAGTEPLIIGKGAVVAANAVLTHSIGDFEVWAGVPARKIATLSPDDPRWFEENIGG